MLKISRPFVAVVACVACFALTTCATTALFRDGIADADRPSSKLKGVDWDTRGQQAFDDLANYLRVDTVNPPGNERNGADFLAALLASKGIESESIDHGENRASLIARVKATKPNGEGAICLVNHIDVVTSEVERWPPERGPLSGAVVDVDGETMVYGRGALDMKGMGMMELHALFALIDSGVERTRDLVYVAVADEEVKGMGIEAIVSDEVWPRVNCTHAINEGGIGLQDAIVEGQTVFAISVGERGILWSRVIAEGPPGHGSTPIPGRAPEKLLLAMNRFDAWRDKPRLHPALYELLAEVGNEAGGVNGYVMQRPFLVDRLVMGRLQEKPTTKAVTNNTVHLTGFWGANSPNVVPSTVWAQYDVRLLPDTSPEQMKLELEALIKDIPGVHLEVTETKAGSFSDWNDPLFRALQRNSVAGIARAIAGPIISPGFTDSIVLRRRGVKAYGIIPVAVTASESSSMHGDAERVSRSNIRRGTMVLAMTLADVASVAPTTPASAR